MRFIRLLSIVFLGSLVLIGCTSFTNDAQSIQSLCGNSDLNFERHSPESLLGAGYKAIQVNRYDCAEKLLLQAQTVSSKNPYVPLNLGVVYQRTGRLDKARAAYAEAIELDSSARGDQVEVAVASTKKAVIDRRMSAGEVARYNLTLMP